MNEEMEAQEFAASITGGLVRVVFRLAPWVDRLVEADPEWLYVDEVADLISVQYGELLRDSSGLSPQEKGAIHNLVWRAADIALHQVGYQNETYQAKRLKRYLKY